MQHRHFAYSGGDIVNKTLQMLLLFHGFTDGSSKGQTDLTVSNPQLSCVKNVYSGVLLYWYKSATSGHKVVQTVCFMIRCIRLHYARSFYGAVLQLAVQRLALFLSDCQSEAVKCSRAAPFL